MVYTILDCYTDEAAGLGVPPYLGTYPRYIAGHLGGGVNYITIDDLRFFMKYDSKIKKVKPSGKTDIFTYNLTKNADKIGEILDKTEKLIIVLGVHVPGKYLSAVPGTLNEVVKLIKDIKCEKILTGPAVYGTQLHGGKLTEAVKDGVFDKIDSSLFRFKYSEVKDVGLRGAEILNQIPDIRMIEIETGRGCDIGKCSFCTEPLKNRVEFREKNDVIKEIGKFYELGARYFRLGKQACFYTYPDAVELLKDINKKFPEIKVLHIDNVNPVKVMVDKRNNFEITKAVVKYCTSGNVAAFGVESFDPVVVKENTLNTSPKIGYEAIKIINELGSERGKDGLPKFIPGINLIYGLIGESKKTHEENMKWLKRIYDEGLMLRRINIRQAAIFEGTSLYEKSRDKYLKKNKKFYWKWRNQIRQEIDFPMLKRIVPEGTVLKNCYAEIYDGKTTFMRQFGTYPLIVGVKKRYELKKFYDVKIVGHMLRSVVGEIVE
tara:strand:- start:126 stop:1595 length:1470 start_codon:yes stop_codon:yes gene_type:complete